MNSQRAPFYIEPLERKKGHSGEWPSQRYLVLLSASETLGFIKPEFPTLVPEPPKGRAGFTRSRTLLVIDRGQARAFTRNGNDWTRAYRRAHHRFAHGPCCSKRRPSRIGKLHRVAAALGIACELGAWTVTSAARS